MNGINKTLFAAALFSSTFVLACTDTPPSMPPAMLISVNGVGGSIQTSFGPTVQFNCGNKNGTQLTACSVPMTAVKDLLASPVAPPQFSFHAYPNVGFYLANWDAPCASYKPYDPAIIPDNNYCIIKKGDINTTANLTITANFAPDVTVQNSALSPSLKQCVYDTGVGSGTLVRTVGGMHCAPTGHLDLTGANLMPYAGFFDVVGGALTTADLTQLVKIAYLNYVSLDTESFSDVSPLLNLKAPQLIRFANTPNLDCTKVAALRTKFGASVVQSDKCM